MYEAAFCHADFFTSADQIETTWEMSRVSHKTLGTGCVKQARLQTRDGAGSLCPSPGEQGHGAAGTAPLLVIPHAGSSLGGGKPARLAECILRKGLGLFCADKYSADGHGTLAMEMLSGLSEMLQFVS